MGRRRKTTTVQDQPNALAEALEAGKPIEGMKGYICLRDKDDEYNDEDGEPIYVQVRVIGLSAKECGLKVRIQVVSGKGELDIPPCRWKNSIEDLEAERTLNRAIKAAEKDYESITIRGYLLRGKRIALAKYVESKLSKEQQAEIQAEAREQYGIAAISAAAKLSESAIKNLAKAAVFMVYGLDPTMVKDSYTLD